VTQSQCLAPPWPAAFGYGMGNTQKFCKMNECLLGRMLLLSFDFTVAFVGILAVWEFLLLEWIFFGFECFGVLFNNNTAQI